MAIWDSAMASMDRGAAERIYIINAQKDWVVKCAGATKHKFDKEIDLEGGTYPFFVVKGKVCYPKNYTYKSYAATSKLFKGLKKPLLFGNKQEFVGNKYIVKADDKTKSLTLRVDQGLIKADPKDSDYDAFARYGDMIISVKWDYIDPVPFYEILKKSGSAGKTNFTVISTSDLAQIVKAWLDQAALKFAVDHAAEIRALGNTLYEKTIKPISNWEFKTGKAKSPKEKMFDTMKPILQSLLNQKAREMGLMALSRRDVVTIAPVDVFQEQLEKMGVK